MNNKKHIKSNAVKHKDIDSKTKFLFDDELERAQIGIEQTLSKDMYNY